MIIGVFDFPAKELGDTAVAEMVVSYVRGEPLG